MTRLLDASSGSVEINGVDVKSLPLAEVRHDEFTSLSLPSFPSPQVRRLVGVVSQDSSLFDASVAHNIRYGDLKATDAQIHAAATLAQA